MMEIFLAIISSMVRKNVSDTSMSASAAISPGEDRKVLIYPAFSSSLAIRGYFICCESARESVVLPEAGLPVTTTNRGLISVILVNVGKDLEMLHAFLELQE